MLRRARLAALLLAKRRRGTWVLAPLSLFLYLPMSIDAVQFVPQMEEGAGSPSPSPVRPDDGDDDVAYKERHVILPPPIWLWAMNTKVTERGRLRRFMAACWILYSLGYGILATRNAMWLYLSLSLSGKGPPTSAGWDRKEESAAFFYRSLPADDTAPRWSTHPPTPSFFRPIGHARSD